MIIYISFVKRENASMTFCWQPHLLPKLVFWMIRLSRRINLREEDHGKKWHRFWLCLHYTVILISNVQIPASVESKLIVDLNSNCHDCSVQKNREKLQWFLAGWYGRISHWWKKVVSLVICLICQQPLTQRNSSMLCHKEWLAPSTTLPHKMARGTV